MIFKDNTQELIKSIQQAAIDAGEEIGTTKLADIQSNTPVLTGNLKRSITFVKNVNTDNIKVTWGSNIVYAAKVEFENKSYIRDTLRNDSSQIIDIIVKHLKGVSK
ncbi:HK97 gp10 family phage protein [Clostridium sp. SHJSY1]|uniref:HK97 gp10 family phage protein n=1 Tax=Clostridium sp. SHJSY1 TaxID=2942483 RepID=UPI0028758738|nr:HK97 gp10 family phage protein [Clostridium sp. SHJSY1]MDS0525460.1 HK97 gp10 family phage protein [Clostridium sp. SHJSY1]